MQRPYVLLSAAMSADGYIDDASQRRLVLSGPEDLDRVDAERARCDAVMVGAQTVRSDNPRLLVRSERRQAERVARGLPASPAKVTITASGDLDAGAAFFADDGAAKLVYAAEAVAGGLARQLTGVAEVVAIPAGAGLGHVLADLEGRGVSRLMIEGGAVLLGQVLAAGLADEFQLAVAPVLIGDPAAPRLLMPPAPDTGRWPAPGQAGPDDGRSGQVTAGRMVLARLDRAGDVAVLYYRPAGNQAR